MFPHFPQLRIYNDPIDEIINKYKGRLHTLILSSTTPQEYRDSILRTGEESVSHTPLNVILITYETTFNNEKYTKQHINLLKAVKNNIKQVVICGNESSTDFLATDHAFMSLFQQK
jgi:hypothetical protein